MANRQQIAELVNAVNRLQTRKLTARIEANQATTTEEAEELLHREADDIDQKLEGMKIALEILGLKARVNDELPSGSWL